MLKDINFDLFNQVAEISKFLDRYDTYMQDSADCRSCQDVWKKMKEHREEELSMLLGAVKETINAGNIHPHEAHQSS